MLAEIHLNDGEKFQVLLVAFCLFLSALIVSLCLAINCCPLNKWLLDRDEKRRKRLQELAIHRQRSIARSHQITSQQSYYTNYHNSNNRFHNNTTNNNNKCAPQLANFIGPPPAYEAALHATRLQSLTSNSLVPDGGGGKTPSNQESGRQGHHDSPDWLKQALTSQQSECELANERPLDLGDYFHSPKEPFFGPADLYYNQQRPNHLAIPIYPMATNWCNNNTTYCTTTNGAPSATKPARLQAPVMLRLWVKLLEPDELIKRAREQTAQARSAQAESRPRRLSISRQLSIPQLFGSLLTLAGAKQQSGPGPTMAICDKDNNQSNQNQNEQDNNKHNEEESRVTINNSTTTDQQQQQLESTSSLSSLSSASSSSAAEPSSNSISTNTTSTTTTSSEQPDNSTTNSSTTTPKRAPPPKRPAELLPGGGRLPAATGGGSLVANTQRRCSLPTVRSITSRVLHMNVASFSYVKDENFISTKKHNQLNFHHFYSNKLAGSNSPSRKFAAAKGAKDNKMCQLLVSICDIENLLGASCLEERACLRLAQNSSVYVKCEILAPKSSGTKSAASRLLRNPLRVLTHQESSASLSSTTAGTHTIDFGPTIPATVIEPTRTATPRTAAAGSSPTSDIESARPAESSTADKPSSYSETPHTDTGAQEQFNSLASVSSDGDQEQQQDSQQQQQTRQHHNGSTTRPTVNWRHEPAADGKPIVVFNSIPKQIAQQQQLAFSSMVVTPQTTEASVNNNNSSSCNSIHGSPAMHSLESCTSTTGCGSHIQQQQPIDMIQFDSVFVSPILSKSLLENGHIRLRVYAQCKYVNETCLAELKLPLKQLMRTQSRDNLGDVGSGGTGNGPHQQADFILNNLLANLVTASTGSPLSTLIEQISAEEEREEAEAAGFRATATTNTRVQFARNRQLSDDNHTGTTTTTSGHSLGDHFRLATSWLGSAAGGTARQTPQGSTTTAQLPRSSSSPNAAFTISSSSLSDKWPPHYNYLNGLEMDTSAMTNNSQADQQKQQQLNNNQEGDQVEGQQQHQQLMDDENNGGQLCSRQLIEQNYCRSLMVSHWLNYLVAPSYECQLVEEQRGKLVLGLTYLPTSNRLVFNAHRASIEPPNSGASLAGWDHKQLVKRLRMQSDTTYLLRFMMVANNRVIKRKQTACSRKPEWDSQEPVTFDLVNVNVEQPSFVVALVMRNPHSLASAGLGGGGSLQSLASYYQLRPCVPGGGGPQDRLDEGLADTDERWLSSGGGARRPGGPSGQQGLRGEPLGASSTCQSDPESLRLGRGGHASGIYRSGVELARRSPHELRPTTKAKRDLVVGHLVLADELWNELKAQPRKQLVKQFNLL